MRFRANLTLSSFSLFREVIECFNKISSSSSSSHISSAKFIHYPPPHYYCLGTAENANASHFLVIGLNMDSVFLSLKKNMNFADEIQGYANLDTAQLFYDYILQSKAEGNAICIRLQLPHLHQVLQSGKGATQIMMRLLKKNKQSFLSLRTRTIDIDIVQNIPIDVMSLSSLENYKEPNVPRPQVALELPNLKTVRNILDRLKSMSKFVHVKTSMNGTIIFQISTDTLNLQNLHTNLKPRNDIVNMGKDDLDEEEERSQDGGVTSDSDSMVKVDAKQLFKSLSIATKSSSYVLCCMTENHPLVLHNILVDNAGSITYFVPVLTLEE